MPASSLKKFKKKMKRHEPGNQPGCMRAELDSHADTCCFGSCCQVLADTGKRITVNGFNDELGEQGVMVATIAVAYDCPKTGETYLLIFHESLYIPGISVHLLNPNQMRMQGIEVNEVPLLLLPEDQRSQRMHSVVSVDPPMHIPLTLTGVMSGFTVRTPTKKECTDFDEHRVVHVHMTSDQDWEPEHWDPSDIEGTLREQLSKGLTFEPNRDLYKLQVRGQDGGTVSEPVPDAVAGSTVGTVEGDQGASVGVDSDSDSDSDDDSANGGASVGVGSPSGDTDMEDLESSPAYKARISALKGEITEEDGTFYVCPGPGVPDTGVFSYERKVSLAELQQEQRHLAALEVDRYAEALMDELEVDELSSDERNVSLTTTHKKRAGFVDPRKLARNWKIGLEAARRTVEATTQLAVRDFTHTTGGRRLKPIHWVLRHKRLDVEVYTDTKIAKCKSLRGNTCAQVYATAYHFVCVYPMEKKGDAHLTLDDFFRDKGCPPVMVSDQAPELVGGDFKKKCRKAQVKLHPVEAYTPNANLAEHAIRELNRLWRRTMTETGCPEVLWDYCYEWCGLIRSHTALNIRALDGQVPMTKLTGDTADISFLAEFSFYQWVWYITPSGKTDNQEAQDEQMLPSMQTRRLGRYLGPALNDGDAMCAKVLTESTKVINRTSVFPLTEAEASLEAVQQKKKLFNEKLSKRLKKRVAAVYDGKPSEVIEEEAARDFLADVTPVHEPYAEHSPEDVGCPPELVPEPDKEPLPELKEVDDLDLDLNNYISAKVKLPRDGHTFATGKVIKRARDSEGLLIGKSNPNPLLDTSVYEVQFEDGEVERYNANIIAEHIYSQVDADGYGMTLLDEILDHKVDENAVKKEDGWKPGPNGSRVPRETTKGWWLLVRLKDHSTEWIKLKDLKDSNPLEVAQYAVDNKLTDEPAFKWWVPFTIRKRNRILKAMKKRYFRTHQKFGIELPKTVERALEIDKETGTTFWRDAIEKEMKTVMVAFDILPEGAARPVGRDFIKCHLVFDVKQGSLQRKARFVADGSRTDVSNVPTYASVVSRESVRIAFTLAALNGLDILAADCEGAYLNAPSGEKLYTICGAEFGELKGRFALITRALYGSKSASCSWRRVISSVIEALGFKMCRADNDVWMKAGTNAAGADVWEYVLVYSDDLLIIAKDPETVASYIDQHCKLKKGSVKKPDQYLGANVGELDFGDGTKAWYMSSDSYCKAAIQNIETWLNKRGELLPTRTACVFPSGWKPELDVTPELKEEDANYFMQQIGVLRWLVELGRIDIATEVSMLAAYSACPRQGHLAAVIHLYAYLKKNTKSKMVFDPSRMDHEPAQEPDWSDFYKPQQELIPEDMPEPRGNAVQMTCYVDSDHAGDEVTRRSRTGVLIFIQRAPIIFYTKKQGSIETSSFGSELSAMKTAVELIEGLRYKLRMMGVPLEGQCVVKADNMSVVHNCSTPESKLKKKSNSIAYHYVRERVAAGVCNVSYIPTAENISDILTKSQPGPVRKRLAEKVLF